MPALHEDRSSGMTHIVPFADPKRGKRAGPVYFNRVELSQLLSLYSTRVALGEWRDYAIDHQAGMAVFSVFRHTHDRPLFAITKQTTPRGPDYAVFDQRRKLRRSASLAEVLEEFERRLYLVTE